ncbi:MAG: EamA family transporter [Chloroflexota bacterium]|nr:EamA family transporter [Chloroflexota bacterium]MDE2969188.1 EamA family transporter [Chloroflexota bacterium]
MLGALFAVLSALSFAFSTITARRGVIGSSASFGLYITVILGVPLFTIAALATGQLFDTLDLSSEALGMLAGAGVLHFLIGRYCNYRCIDAIGSNRSQPLQTTNTIYSVVIAVIVLNEEVTLLMGVGIALLVVGPMIMVERRRQQQPEPAAARASSQPAAPPQPSGASSPDAARPRRNAATDPSYVEGYTFGLLSAAAYGTSPIMIRYALEDTGLGIAGGLVAYVAAAGVLILALAIPGRVQDLRGFSLKVVPMFAASAVAVFLAQLFRFAALAIAPVSLVTPLARLGVVFVPTLSFVFNRNLESFSLRVLTGIALSGLGAVLLALGIT